MGKEVLDIGPDLSTNFYEPKEKGKIMRTLVISLLLLTLAGCAHSNLARHRPALYYDDSKALADQNRQQYLADQNRPQQNFPHSYPYTYTILAW